MLATSTPQTRPRWFQFSLRALLVLIAVVAVLLAWIVSERRQSQHEQQIAEQLAKQGAKLTLGGPYDELSQNRQPQGWFRRLARQVLGERILLAQITQQDFKDLSPLAGLKNLKVLFLDSTQVNDLKLLAELKSLQGLSLESTPVDDLTPLTDLKQLRWLFLDSTSVNDLKPLSELKNLEELTLGSTFVSDVNPLLGHLKLRNLDLGGTAVSSEQVNSLQKSLPNCKVEHWQRERKPSEPVEPIEGQ